MKINELQSKYEQKQSENGRLKTEIAEVSEVIIISNAIHLFSH